MPRKKPTVLMEYFNEDTGKCEQVLEGEHIYVVCFDDKPVSIKTFNKYYDYPGARYKRTSFTNPAHAYNLRDRLNDQYDTTQYNVKIFSVDDIEEDDF